MMLMDLAPPRDPLPATGLWTQWCPMPERLHRVKVAEISYETIGGPTVRRTLVAVERVWTCDVHSRAGSRARAIPVEVPMTCVEIRSQAVYWPEDSLLAHKLSVRAWYGWDAERRTVYVSPFVGGGVPVLR